MASGTSGPDLLLSVAFCQSWPSFALTRPKIQMLHSKTSLEIQEGGPSNVKRETSPDSLLFVAD